jgi:tetratricopeptide (TPR) repeat protein
VVAKDMRRVFTEAMGAVLALTGMALTCATLTCAALTCTAYAAGLAAEGLATEGLATGAPSAAEDTAHPPADPSALSDAHHYELLAYTAAMAGRKAETLEAVQHVVQALPLDTELATGASGWDLAQQYAALVRFGLWDEMIALGAPDPRARGLTAGYLYGRGVALAARGRMKDANASLAELRALAAATAADERAGSNSLRDVLAVAQPIVAARIAASEGRSDDAVTLLQQAVAAEDGLTHAEPADWFFPARHLLGAQLLIGGRASEAARVYREDLTRNPANGWALYGLAQALRAERETSEAARVTREFETAWHDADVRLVASAFWFAGPDTTSCECQRRASADGQSSRELLGAQHEAGVH